MTETDFKVQIKELEITQIFGFDGRNPLRVHPDQQNLIFALGSKVSILNLLTNKQDFLSGHTHNISTLDISKSGRLIGSGQINHMGFRAYVIVWDYEKRTEILRHELHKVRVESICFTSDEEYLISLGGKDCGMIIVWNINKKTALCGNPATRETTGMATKLCAMNNRSQIFVSGGNQNLRLWSIDMKTRRIIAQDVAVGKLRREFTCMKVDSRDEIMYVGTKSGDIVKVYLNCPNDINSIEREKTPVLLGCYARWNPRKPYGKDCEKFENGVRDLLILNCGKQLIVGSGDGSIEIIEERDCKFKDYPSCTWPNFKVVKRARICGAVISSLQIINGEQLLIGTESCEIYSINLRAFENSLKLLKTCHTSTIHDIAFPYNFPTCFATASYESIRIWSTSKMQELLRIVVPNFTSKSVIFSRDGKKIISAWNDGVIRVFTPITGRLIFAIPNAHNKGCTSVAITSNGKTLVSGGGEGQVRVWKIVPEKQSLVGVLKEHYGPVSSVEINKFDTELVSASSGSCIIWDLIRLSRKHVLFANTQFTCARYLPSGVQILAAGTDRLISYWESYDGSLVREKEGSKVGPVNCLDINQTGEYFVSSGEDQIVKLWNYEQGETVAVGHGHAGIVTAAKYSPNGKFLVTGGCDGAIFIWKVPEEFLFDPDKEQKKDPIKKANTNIHLRQPEQIREINSRRSNRSNTSIVTECPEVDKQQQPNVDPGVDILLLEKDFDTASSRGSYRK